MPGIRVRHFLSVNNLFISFMPLTIQDYPDTKHT